jgi:hypothetical protein
MQKLGLSEFKEVFYDNLDTLITTSQVHVRDYEDFYEEVIFRCFDVYQRENSSYEIRDIVKLFHIFLFAMFKYKPSVDRNEDEILIN